MADALDRLAPQGAVDDGTDLAESGKNNSPTVAPENDASRTDHR